MLMQISHLPQGDAPGETGQFTALASRRAMVVLPTPRGPLNRYAWASRPPAIALSSVLPTCS